MYLLLKGVIVLGSRGAFIDVNEGNFNFTEGGQRYETIGEVDGIMILNQTFGPVKAPEYSHTSNRIYAIIQKGRLKHVAFYDENHKQVKVIDFGHPHGTNKVCPHVHFNLIHNKNEPGTPPSSEDLEIINKFKKELGIE